MTAGLSTNVLEETDSEFARRLLRKGDYSALEVLESLLRKGRSLEVAHAATKGCLVWCEAGQRYLPSVEDVELAILYYADGLDRLAIVLKFRDESGMEAHSGAAALWIVTVAEWVLDAYNEHRHN
jgi:hypothetical protein